MLQRVADTVPLGANPVNAFAVRIRLRCGLVRGSFANRIHLFDGHAFVLVPILVLVFAAIPAHLLGNPRLGLFGLAALIQQFQVFVRARVALLQELLVIVLVPFRLGVFLSALLLLDGRGELFHEIGHFARLSTSPRATLS
jgi:hypothetical protein